MQQIAGESVSESFSFWKNMFLMIIFFSVTPITLAVSLFSLVSLKQTPAIIIDESVKTGVKVYASLPNEFPTVNGFVESKDARPEIIKAYLIRYKSPLLGHEDYIIKKSDEYGLDFRLITAIAQQESNLCKIIPPETYNCWGWGIHSRGTLGFQSYEEAIDAVTLGLKNEYINKGLTTPDTIWKKYTPSSPDGAWAKGVNQFMSEME
jgi:hypothetical protein